MNSSFPCRGTPGLLGLLFGFNFPDGNSGYVELPECMQRILQIPSRMKRLDLPKKDLFGDIFLQEIEWGRPAISKLPGIV
jgi:hypothetical protein